MRTYWTEHMRLLDDITMQSNGTHIDAVHWGCIQGEGQREKTPLISDAFLQLQEYLNGERKHFTVPFLISGTPFVQGVYRALIDIPYGQTASYQDIAVKIGHPRACRAVGMANHRNPLPIFVPCHRVIQKKGGLGGFASGLSYKQALIELERNNDLY